MATSKKFAVAGISTLEGKTKLRFANDTMRIKILAKNGHTDIELIDLPYAMTKGEIAQYMKETGFGAGKPEVEAAIEYVAKKNPLGADADPAAVDAEEAAVDAVSTVEAVAEATDTTAVVEAAVEAFNVETAEEALM